MRLSMTVLRCPDGVAPETRSVTGGEFYVGRGPSVDWVLPDPGRLLSKRHFAIAFRAGEWQIADTSTNGTFLNSDGEALGRGSVQTLTDGDRLRLGAYEIEVRLEDQPQHDAGSPFDDDPFVANIRGAPAGQSPPFAERYADPPPPPGPQLPANFDMDEPEFAGWRGAPGPEPISPEHLPVGGDAVRMTPFPGAAHSKPDVKLPGLGQLPDNWYDDLLPNARKDTDAPDVIPDARPRAEGADFLPDRPVALDSPRYSDLPGDLPGDLRGDLPRELPGDLPGERRRSADQAASPAARLTAETASEAKPATQDSALIAAFLRGAGLAGTAPADPIAMMTELGRSFRAMVLGLRQVMIARAKIKSEFRINQTMISARGNNPLKWSTDEDDALIALLRLGRKADVAPTAAIEEALRDLQLHELAVVSAMQAAVRAMLDELNPGKIRAASDGGLALLHMRKARAWDEFETRHAAILRALVDDFDSVFGKSFARFYERAIDEITAKEGR